MTEQLDTADIQGIVASAYLHLTQSAYVLLKIDPAQTPQAKRWLANLCSSIRTAQGKDDENSINVALSHAGLRSLGLTEAALQSFSEPFISGMRSPRRRSILTDPEKLRWGNDNGAVDVLLLIFAKDAAARDKLVASFTSSAQAAGLSEVTTVLSQIYPDFREHFGFVDGIGQPVPLGFVKPEKCVPQRDIVKNGEFLLGYNNEYGNIAETPQLGPKGDLGRNGTYLVFRQAAQDVGGFAEFIDRAATTNHVDPDLLAAKLVGRWKDGAPLVQAPDATNPAVAAYQPDGTRTIDFANDFGFAAEDPKGLRCPLGAHIRRANPRDGSLHTQSTTMAAQSARHRLLRRGRSYGPRYDDKPREERGLCFIALCADLERQFEFVQQTWINNFAFNDLDEVDPLIAGAPAGKATFTIQAAPMRQRIPDIQTFVTLLGGAYFFVPSMSALRWLAQ